MNSTHKNNDTPTHHLQQPPSNPVAPPPATAPTPAPPPPLPPTEEPFTVRIVSLDYYLAPPIQALDPTWSELEGTGVHRVPVIRIFGSTPLGQKTCLHVHGVLPYFYIPFDVTDHHGSDEDVPAYVCRLATALNAALGFSSSTAAAAARQGTVDDGAAPGPAPAPLPAPPTNQQQQQNQEQLHRHCQRVFGVTLVKGTPFYGYRHEERLWIKIIMYNPRDVGKAAALLLAGAVMGRKFQPHESHVPYLLQFKIDFNLHGMGYMTSSTARFRSPLPAAAIPYSSSSAFASGKKNTNANDRRRRRQRLGWSEREQIVLMGGGQPEVTTTALLTSAELTPTPTTTTTATQGGGTANMSKEWNENTVPPAMRWQSAAGIDNNNNNTATTTAKKTTLCELEVDIRAEDILNRKRMIHIPLRDAGPEFKLVDSLAPMWEEERIKAGLPTPPPPVDRTPCPLDVGLLDRCRDQFKEAIQSSRAAVPDATNTMHQYSIHSLSSSLPSQVFTPRGGGGGQEQQIDFDEELVIQTQRQHPADGGGSGGGADDNNGIEIEHENEDEDVLLPMAMGLKAHENPERAQNVVEEFLRATQQECDDIMDASLQHNDGIAINDNDKTKNNTSRIPQVDGAIDDADADGNAGVQEIEERPRLSRQELIAASQALGAAFRVVSSFPSQQQQQQQGVLVQEEESLPPTQPMDVEEQYDAGVVIGASAQEILKTTAGTTLQTTDAAWWHEEASQIPFDDVDWDLLDDSIRSKEEESEGEEEEQQQQMALVEEKRKFQRPAPTQDQVLQSGWTSHPVVLPIVHTRPHFSNPAHLPSRPPVIAGKEHRLPCIAVTALPPFSTTTHYARAYSNSGSSSSTTTSNLQCKRYSFVRRPPSRARMDAWLATILGGPGSKRHEDGVAVHVANDDRFGMDPNTGKMVPMQRGGGGGTAAPIAPLSYQKKDIRLSGDLMATPSLPSLHTTQRNAMKTPLDERLRRSSGGDRERGATTEVEEEETVQEEEEEIRLASPKYDERSCFFYENPFSSLDKPTRTMAIASPVAVGVAVGLGVGVGGAASATNRRVSISQPQQQQPQRQGVHNRQRRTSVVSQITPPAPPSTGNKSNRSTSSQQGFKRIIPGKGQGLTLACVEVLAESRGQLLPDPRYDAVRAVVIAIADDDEEIESVHDFFIRMFVFVDAKEGEEEGGKGSGVPVGDGLSSHAVNQIERFSSESDLFDAVVNAVRSLDPDIVMGWEVQKDSLGYFSDRAALALERPHLLRELSRMPEEPSPKELPGADEYGWRHASGLHIGGRIVLNVWRLMRGELKLNIYTLENCTAAVLRLRVPHIPAPQLSEWFKSGSGVQGGRWRCLSHLALRARLSLAMLDRLDFIGRTAEMARTFGIDFFSVLSRGSQYRVESMMLRLAHSQNYIALAPSPEQVARQPAMESIPLVMEPQSAMYPDPVCVLDFQSLYPSMIIAYNLCFSTCVGKPVHAKESSRLGCCESYCSVPGIFPCRTDDATTAGDATATTATVDNLIIAPNGVGFVPPSVRPGVLPRLLNEILNTRIMVKGVMKKTPPSSRVLLRCLNARQFGLKLIANVTYGYTAAGFSGRMPMAELADAIVQSGRATLEAAIATVESHPAWRAKVVYGDTDSLFVQLPGRSVEEAFKIGAEIAAVVTASNPPPVVLKLEKVYRPCVLLSKKRYVGSMYESPTQKSPVFDAKGIETVRRDSCPAVAKVMEQTLRILFSSADLSAVREYLERQWTRIITGRVSIADFMFAKEVRLGSYSSRPGSVIPPAALVATRSMSVDPRTEPRYGERVPYVVVYGEPGARLADMVVPPRVLVESGGRLRLHATYYITKQIIPAVERALNLVGADVRAWFAEMHKPSRTLPQKRSMDSLGLASAASHTSNSTIDSFYLSRHCAVCDELTHATKPLCVRCVREPQLAVAVLGARVNRLGRQYTHLSRVCMGCLGMQGTLCCDSLDCGVFFERRKVWYEYSNAKALHDVKIFGSDNDDRDDDV